MDRRFIHIKDLPITYYRNLNNCLLSNSILFVGWYLGGIILNNIEDDFVFPISKEAVMTFADAVLAIAVTLMTLDIRLPELPAGHSESAAISAILALFPVIFAYVRTFIAISVSWFFIRWIYSKIERIDMVELLLTLFYLFFGTAWPLAGYLYFTLGGDFLNGDWASNFTAASMQLACAFVGFLIWWYAANNRRLLARDVTEWEIQVLNFVIFNTLAIFILAIIMLLTFDLRIYPQVMPWFILIFFNGEILLMAVWQKVLFSKHPRGKYVKSVIFGLANVKTVTTNKTKQTISILISLIPGQTFKRL